MVATGPQGTADSGTTGALLDEIEQSRTGGYSLPFTPADRNYLVATHVALTVAALLLTTLTLRAASAPGVPGGPGWSWVSKAVLVVQVLVALVATGCAVRAVRRGHTYLETDRFDFSTASAQLACLVVGTLGTGGTASPLWLLVAAGTAYLAALTTGRSAYVVAAALAVGVGWSGQVDGQWSGRGLPVSLGVLFGITMVLFLVRSVTRQLYTSAEATAWDRAVLRARVHDLSELLDRAAGGDLSVAGQLGALVADDRFADDNIRILADRFDQTLLALSALAGQVQAGCGRMGAAATQVLSSAQDQATAAAQQSSAVVETSVTIEELAATAAQIAETSGHVAEYAAETMAFAEEGRRAVGESVAAMDSIAVGVDQVAARVAGLGEKGQQIGRILSVIDELADQTNLLALNAAIEAARAGEHGRGFAVVAAEVRALAERSAASARQIQTIVTEIQSETTAAILASQEGSRQVSNGAALAHGVVVALERIAGMVDETTTAAREISIATQQQRSASDQVVTAMGQMSSGSRQYAQGSQQAADAASEMNALVGDLETSIAHFRTGRN